MPELKKHSDKAWGIASKFSYTLASDTRTLAAMIDDALQEARNEALREAKAKCDTYQDWCAGWGEDKLLSAADTGASECGQAIAALITEGQSDA